MIKIIENIYKGLMDDNIKVLKDGVDNKKEEIICRIFEKMGFDKTYLFNHKDEFSVSIDPVGEETYFRNGKPLFKFKMELELNNYKITLEVYNE